MAIPGFAALVDADHVLSLPSSVAHKLLHVLRMQVGQGFVMFDPQTSMQASATLCALSPPAANVGAATEGVRARIDIRIIQGLAKGDKNECILQDATELGASCVHFAEMHRSVARVPKDKRNARLARWNAIAESAAGQCGRSDVPRVLGPSTLADALAEHQDARVLVLYERGGRPWGDVLRETFLTAMPVVLVVGPEGGLAEEDLAVLERAGCTYCTLGPYVLRTETVAAAALGGALLLAEDSLIRRRVDAG